MTFLPIYYKKENWATADNTAYTLRANALTLRDIAPFGRNVVYAGNVICHFPDNLNNGGKNVKLLKLREIYKPREIKCLLIAESLKKNLSCVSRGYPVNSLSPFIKNRNRR